MKKLQITRQAVYGVLREYWQQYKVMPWHSAVAFIVPAIGDILVYFIPPLIVARIISIFAAEKTISVGMVWHHILLLGVVWMLGEIFWRVGMHYLIQLETRSISTLSRRAFHLFAERDYSFFSNNFVGSLTKQAIAFARGFEQITDTLSFSVINALFSIIFAIVVLWQYNFWISLVLIACLLISIFVTLPIIKRRSALVVARHEAASRMSGAFSDALTNILAVKSFAREKAEHTRFGGIVDDYGKKFRKAADYQNLRFEAVVSPLYVLSNVIGLILAVFFAGKLGLESGTILVVFTYFAAVTRNFWNFQRIYRNIENAISEAAEFVELTMRPPAVADMPQAREIRITDATISFENLGFNYSKNAKPDERFLQEFNLTIKSGERVGLVGPSGGGKTTITKLILRFIDPQDGKIVIDGQNIAEMTQESLRGAIAYVPQEPLLFHRSLFENIAYGKENATKEEVIEAAKLAHAHEFIDKLKYGYDTLVGERGIKLSGGQRQRIAIARAMIKNAPILVLDEATSALDSESEKYIQQGLWELMKNKTALVIAHRLSTIKHLDRIVVLHEGKIVQDGTHDELIKKPGLYATLWSHQSGEFLSESADQTGE